MSGSHALETAWLLLKDFSFLKDHSPEYIEGLRKRMLDHLKNPGPLEHVTDYAHVNARQHYEDRKAQRFHPNQKMPKGFEKFTPEQVAIFMANDVLSNHPELPEVLRTPIPAPNAKKYGNTTPGMMFDMFVTSNPKDRGDASHIFSPVFAANKDGKAGLLTIGAGIGGTGAGNRHTIHVVPEGGQMPSRKHPKELADVLPARFNFEPQPTEIVANPPLSPSEREADRPFNTGSGQDLTPVPKGMEVPVNFDSMPPHIRDMMIDGYLRRQGGGDDVQTGEPMDLAWRMLKAVIA